MAIIEKKAIISPEAEQPFDNLIKQYDILIAKNNELVKSSTNLQKAFTQVSQAQTSDGAEAKKLVDINQKLIKNNTDLTALQKQRLKVEEQINQVFVKNLAVKEKDALILEKGKVRLAENNRLLKAQAKEALGLTGAYERLTKRTLEAQKNFKQLATEFGVNSKQAKAAKTEFQKLDNQLSRVNKAARDGRKDVGRYGDALKGFGNQFLGALGLTALVSSFVNVIKNAAKIFVSFEKNASKLAAILGKTKDEISSLTQQAKDLGSVTAYTASQVLEAQTELAKLGFTSTQIEKAIPGILSLAAATGTDLAPAAELAASTLRIFNLDASESGRVSDVLAKSTTISSLSMEKLATIMPTVGKTAQLAGVSLERTAALAGTLTDRGLDASTAATSLRNIFLELANKGLTWEQAMAKINNSTDKNKTAMDLFGKRAAAAGAILAETAGSTDDLTTALEHSKGAAKEMADTMLDNLAGDMTIAQSAWEGFVLSLEDGNGRISKILRSITQWFTGLLERLKLFNDGSAKISEFEKERLGINKQIKDGIDKQNAALLKIEDTEARRQKAIETYQKLQKAISQSELDALRAKQDGDTKELTAAQLRIDAYTALLENVKQYIPELQKANQEETTNTDIVIGQTTATKEQTRALEKLRREREKLAKQREQDLKKATKNVDPDTKLPILPGEIPSDVLDFGAQQEADFELARTKQIEDEKVKIKEAAIDAVSDYARNATDSIINNNLQRTKDQVEAEKEILKDKLDKGLISEAEYNNKLRQLNNKERLAEARADKKKALFDIAINTAVAVVKALPNLIRVAGAIAIGGIQAAAVAARPLPKFAKGEINIKGKSHSEGGIVAEIEGGESVITKKGTANAPETLDLINKGMLTDEQILTKKPNYNGLIYKQLGKLNRTNEQILQATENGVSQYEDNGVIYTIFATGRKNVRFKQ